MAGFRGLEWNPQVAYAGSNPNPIYVYYTVDPSDPRLFKVRGALAAVEHPDNPGAPADDMTPSPDPFPGALLEVRRGPNIEFVGSESDVLSAQNVFVLIAVGRNRNLDLDRSHVRDETHTGDAGGSSWSLDSSNDLDPVVFSLTHNIDATDRNNDGDDTLLVMSFIEFKARLKEFGLILQPVCESTCTP